MTEQFILLGMIIIVIGFIILLAGVFSQVKSKQTKVEGGGIIFIGPFPFGFATNKQIFYILLAVSVVLIIAFLLIGRKV